VKQTSGLNCYAADLKEIENVGEALEIVK